MEFAGVLVGKRPFRGSTSRVVELSELRGMALSALFTGEIIVWEFDLQGSVVKVLLLYSVNKGGFLETTIVVAKGARNEPSSIFEGECTDCKASSHAAPTPVHVGDLHTKYVYKENINLRLKYH